MKIICLTNRRQFSIVYTLIDHKMTSKMFKTQVEPRAAGEWFHCQTFNSLWRHFMVYKSIDHRNLPSSWFFDNNKEKVRAELAIFFVEKARALHLTSFLLSV